MLAYCICYFPTIALTNSLTFGMSRMRAMNFRSSAFSPHRVDRHRG